MNGEWQVPGGLLTNVSDEICCDYPAALGEVVKVVCDGHHRGINNGDFEVDEENAEKKSVRAVAVRHKRKIGVRDLGMREKRAFVTCLAVIACSFYPEM